MKTKTEEYNKRKRETYNRLKENNLCVKCYKPLNDLSIVRCPQCHLRGLYFSKRNYENNKERYIEKEAERRKRLREEGRCKCGLKLQEDWKGVRCPNC